MKKTRNQEFDSRAGFGRVELLVCLVIFALLFTLLAPAMQRPRISARKLQCLNNMRNVGLAMQNFASGSDGNLPLLTSEIEIPRDTDEQATLDIPWTIALLPMLDSIAVLKNIRRNAIPLADQPSGATMTLADSEKIWLPFFTCPDDPDSFRQPGRLNFVVNTGFVRRDFYYGDPRGLHRLGQLSWDGNAILDEPVDIKVGAATGVVWRQNDVISPNLDYIAVGDGTSTTIMLTENVQAGFWYDSDTAKIAFGLPVDAPGGQVPFGAGALFESVERPLNTEFSGGNLATAAPHDWRINADLKAKIGTRPRPSSTHTGGVNVMMCDGSGRFVSETIDPHVYVKILTSNGVRYGEGNLNSAHW